MSRIFLSHSSKESFEAVALKNWLASRGWNDVFLDLDPMRGIIAAERRERALHAASSRCEAVIFLVSASWLASRWCQMEYMLARGLNKKLFAALIDPSQSNETLPLISPASGRLSVWFRDRTYSCGEALAGWACIRLRRCFGSVCRACISRLAGAGRPATGRSLATPVKSDSNGAVGRCRQSVGLSASCRDPRERKGKGEANSSRDKSRLPSV